jgi:hypothetical protein
MKRILLVEYGLTLATALACLFVTPLIPRQWVRRIWSELGKLADRRLLSVLILVTCTLVFRAALWSKMPTPVPQIHDEFSYLLAADTFASGRLKNPTHPLWTHFETFHVNQQPTYASAYPPAQGLLLAAGQVIARNPFGGVMISAAVMCGALCWMLQGWLPPRWALLGGFIAVIRIGLFSYWGNSYWGGALAATGGLFILGAVPRLLRMPRLRDAFLMGLGLTILANTRPFEGLVLCVGVAVAFLPKVIRQRRLLTRKSLWGPPIFLLFVVLIAATALMGYYFWRVTGSPFRMPYEVNRQTYWMGQAFLWQSPRTDVQYRHREMRILYEAWLEAQLRARSSLQGFLRNTFEKIRGTGAFFLGPLLTLALAGLPRALRDKRIRPLITIGAVGSLGLLGETWFHPHYVAPFMGVIYAVCLQSMRHLRCSRWHGRPSGQLLALMFPLVAVAMAVIAFITLPKTPVQDPSFRSWCCVQTGPSERSQLLATLKAEGGRHLVIVKYAPNHDVDSEWVYNEADIDRAQVVFARDMGEAENAILIQYFQDRAVWLLEADNSPPNLRRYQ